MNARETDCLAAQTEWGVVCGLPLDHESAHFGEGPQWSGYWGRGVLHMDRVRQAAPSLLPA